MSSEYQVRGNKGAPPVVPRRKAKEGWPAYHDRLAALAVKAREKGDTLEATALEMRAGQVAYLHENVRKKARKRSGRKRGPGTYPWDQCIRDAESRLRKQGQSDVKERAKKICGSIRARSRRAYPAYWAMRDPPKVRPNPFDWKDRKGYQYATEATMVGEMAIIQGPALGDALLIAAGFESAESAERSARAKIDQLAGMA